MGNESRHLRKPTESSGRDDAAKERSRLESTRLSGGRTKARSSALRNPVFESERREAARERAEKAAKNNEKQRKKKPETAKEILADAAKETMDRGGKYLRKQGRVLRDEVAELINPDAVRPDDIVRVRGGVDRPMLTIILLLVCFGSAMVFSASYAYALSRHGNSYYFIRNQLLYASVGLFAMFIVSQIDYRFVKKLSIIYFLVVVVLLLLIFVPGLGVQSGSARRWLRIPGVTSIQPSEFMKLGIVLILAWYYQFAERKVRDSRFFVSSVFGTVIPAVILAFVCILIALERHISGTIIMFLIGVLVIFCGGGKTTLLAGGGVGFGLIVSAIIAATGYASKRLDIWLHPENYAEQSEVWQTLQGLYAVGSGGMLGVGLGESRQKHLFVSQPQNDFIFSIICEELGFIGAVLVLLLFAVFIWRGFTIAMKAPDTFSRLTVIGIVSKVGIQALLNIAVVTGSIPNTGITLPFFSYGGSSLSVLLVEMGIVLSISRYSIEQK